MPDDKPQSMRIVDGRPYRHVFVGDGVDARNGHIHRFQARDLSGIHVERGDYHCVRIASRRQNVKEIRPAFYIVDGVDGDIIAGGMKDHVEPFEDVASEPCRDRGVQQ